MIEKITTEFPDFDDLKYKINELIDAVNELQEEAKENARIRANHEKKIDELQESVQGVVDNSIKDGAYIQNLEEDVKALRADVDHILNYCPIDLVEKLPENTQNAPNIVKNSHLFQGNEQKDHKIRSTNERLREALSLAENALIRLANNTCDMDIRIYIDAILSRIDTITKGGKDE